MSEEKKDGRDFIFNYKHFEKCFFSGLVEYQELLNSMLLKLKIMAAHKTYCNESYQKKFDKIQQWFIKDIKWANKCIIMTIFGAGEDYNSFINKTYNDNLPLKINIKGIEDEKNYGDEWNNVSSGIPHYDFKLFPVDLPGIHLLGKPTRVYEINETKYYSFIESNKLWRAEWELEKEMKGERW